MRSIYVCNYALIEGMMKTNIFKRDYVGPEGPHLNCLTQTSITGSYEESKQRSIHPGRSWKKALAKATAKTEE